MPALTRLILASTFLAGTLVPSLEAQQPSRNAFVRDQTILGLAAYGPAFATMVGDDGITWTAGYLVMAGGSFFAAAELSRRMEITEARQLLSTRMAWRGAISGLYIAAAADADSRPVGASALIGGFAGTAAGLIIGKGLTPGEAMATVFGHDLAFASSAAVLIATDPRAGDDRGLSDQARALVLTGSGLAGYALGRVYAGNASYNITAGDVETLWVGTTIGAAAAGTIITESGPSDQAVALTLLGGGLVGAVMADRLLVRRYDHSRSDGNLVALGAAAGGLMGVGVGVLAAGEANRDGALTIGLATVGATVGVMLAERYVQPGRDGGRQFGAGRLRIDPVGLAAVASGVHGRHSLVQFTF